MAEVLSPWVPQSTSTAMLQTRPSSSDQFQSTHSSQSHHQQQPRLVQMPRNNIQSHSGASGYRGTSAAPTYAFKTTPTLRNENRTATPPSTGMLQPSTAEDQTSTNKQRHPTQGSTSTASSSSSNPASSPPTWSQTLFSKDDSILGSNFEVAPFTTQNSGNPPQANAENLSKPSPNRYRRGNGKADANMAPAAKQAQNMNNTTPMGQFTYSASQGTLYSQKLSNGLPKPNGEIDDAVQQAGNAVVNPEVDAETPAPSSQSAASLKRYRRRSSLGTLETNGAPKSSPGSEDVKVAPANPASDFPSSPHEPPRPSSSRQNGRPSSPGGAQPRANIIGTNQGSSGPARTFAEVARRTNTPSPLSRPITPSESPSKSATTASGPPSQQSPGSTQAFQHSPAVAAMAAINEKESNKGVKSRLRRAFSFGSSAELRRATGEPTAADRAQARKEQFSSELDEEQDAIARKQEAAGLGESIYSGQAGFTGSTDNLSISSTASSASMMLRKMGKGVKKGGRSIKGLFRPKSAIGVPPPDSPTEASTPQVTMVTVEAEREKVNVNADPHEQSGGGTGFPKLERNSVDAARASTSVDGEPGNPGSHEPRRSIVGGENERQEVLAAVKRGILKRSTTGSPSGSPKIKPFESPFMQHENASVERHASPAPSNTSSEPRQNGHRRTDSVTLENDYFGGLPRLANVSSRSLPGTPRSIARNISFSPRIQFHDVWSSSEYDRRGDIATCNRLTPMLAQQIKEELNTFKMEMEVHESSKPHTHFF